ncbi:zinc permease [Ornatilinea apprima]|uniref:Zinc permease n=1 Tax=Ornatilinea apprima TaxID=1134406 RepID=A0A0P6XL47_9CHLR|nr:ZIP family metal transporter [Ornatilinea apprima]KPL76934.1 zinc permease [Ornatilinea apprima]
MFLNTFGAVTLASFLACLVTSIGIYTISAHEQWGNRNVIYFMSFAAGVLISVSFIHIIPKSIEMTSQAPIYLLVGFMGLYIINRFVSRFVCRETDCRNISIGVIPMVGIGLHSFIDGVIYSVTFNVSIFTGVLAAIGMVLHEFPEGVVTFLLLEQAGFPRKKAAVMAFLAAALTTPLGTLISFPVINQINQRSLGNLLGLSAGALVYVGATHLLPAVENEKKQHSMISLGAGILIAILIVISKG